MSNAAEVVDDEEESPPRANRQHLETVVSGRGFNEWHYKTRDSLDAVMAPAYFDSASEHGLRRHDLIEVLASSEAPASERAVLEVTQAVCQPAQDRHIRVRPIR